MFTRKQARLPETLEGSTLAGLLPGESAYTVAWAMWADGDRLCWLMPDYPVDGRPGGTVDMRVEHRSDGYHVWPPDGHRYTPSRESGFVGGPGKDPIPVAKLHVQ